jgi:hypothetical protein
MGFEAVHACRTYILTAPLGDRRADHHPGADPAPVLALAEVV